MRLVESIHKVRLAASFVISALLLMAIAGTASAATGLGSWQADLSASAPGNLYPYSGAGFYYPDDALSFEWDSVGGATNYKIQIALLDSYMSECNASSFSEGDIRLENSDIDTTFFVPNLLTTGSTTSSGSSTSSTVGDIFANGTYCWRVQALKESSSATDADSTSSTDEGGTWSTPASYTLMWSADPTNLRFYNDSSDIPRTSDTGNDYTSSLAGYLSWAEVAGASSYDVEVATASSFAQASRILFGDNLKGSSIALPHLPDDTYYWRVRSVNGEGQNGNWVTGEAYTIAWTTMDTAPSAVSPANNSTVSEVKLQWNPVAGATYYEVQAATGQSCFNNESVIGEDYLSDTGLTDADHCRLTEETGAITMNNGITLHDLVSSSVMSDMIQYGLVNDQPSNVWHWRVRPVAVFNQSTESAWDVSGDIVVKGKWLETTSGGGGAIGYRFTLDPTLATEVGSGTICDNSPINDGTGAPGDEDECLVQTGSFMQADSSSGDSTSLQLPLLDWEPFKARFSGTANGLSDSYIIQMATDPNFNNMLLNKKIETVEFGWQTSWIPTYSLPDNAEGTGYWWRVIPCDRNDAEGSDSGNPCLPLYYESQAGLWDLNPGTHGAMSFAKQVDMYTSVSANFADYSPLLSWTPVNGAQFYEVQISKSSNFAGTLETRYSSQPRMVAETGTGSSKTALADGTYYWRVRSVTSETLGTQVYSTWTTGDAFTKRIPAPVPASPTSGTSTPTPVLRWNPLRGADSYEVQVSKDSTFKAASSEPTRQTAYGLDVNGSYGRWYWRVRAVVGANKGLWSSTNGVPSVIVTAPPAISYEVKKSLLTSGQRTIVNGELAIASAGATGQQLVLQQKSGTCSASSGSYQSVASSTTGSAGEEGVARFNRKISTSRCYRMKWNDGSKDYYSAPFPIKAKPSLKAKVSKTKVRRGKGFYVTVTSKQRVTGTMRIQYKVKSKWVTMKTMRVNRMSKKKVRVSMNKAGSFQVRAYMTGLGSYENTAVSAGRVKSNDLFTLK